MPPSKKQQAKAVAPAETSPPIATLLTRCSRADLERMLEESVTAGVPIMRERQLIVHEVSYQDNDRTDQGHGLETEKTRMY